MVQGGGVGLGGYREEGYGFFGGSVFQGTKTRLPTNTEPSTVNNNSVLKPLILFCDWRGLIKESPR